LAADMSARRWRAGCTVRRLPKGAEMVGIYECACGRFVAVGTARTEMPSKKKCDCGRDMTLTEVSQSKTEGDKRPPVDREWIDGAHAPAGSEIPPYLV